MRFLEYAGNAVRIQPHDIEVPADDPFKHDLLGRKESVDVLTHLVNSFEGPCVMAVDAAWGNGKTTFLRIWRRHLLNLEFPVVRFNAWETDFAGDPFLALSTELTEGLKEYAGSDDKIHAKINATRKLAKKVMRRAIPGIIRAITAGILDVNPLLEKELGGALASIAEDRFSEYKSAKDSIAEFRSALQEIADTLAKCRDNRPLIVMIDELDRCRPSYAVELLEVAKHFFSVNRIVFVLAVNRSELTHSIKALYGTDFDANGYLRRFVDIDFRLPDPDRKNFIKSALSQIRIDDYFSRTQDVHARIESRQVEKMLQTFFRTPDLSLRQIGQAIHRLGLIFASLRSDQRSFALSAIVALVFRTIDSDLYHRFCRHEIDDLEAIDTLFQKLRPASPSPEDRRAQFEAVIIEGWREIAYEHDRSATSINSPLHLRYKELDDSRNKSNAQDTPEIKHAHAVLSELYELDRLRFGRSGIGFLHSVSRIELLSAGLMDEASPENDKS